MSKLAGAVFLFVGKTNRTKQTHMRTFDHGKSRLDLPNLVGRQSFLFHFAPRKTGDEADSKTHQSPQSALRGCFRARISFLKSCRSNSFPRKNSRATSSYFRFAVGTNAPEYISVIQILSFCDHWHRKTWLRAEGNREGIRSFLVGNAFSLIPLNNSAYWMYNSMHSPRVLKSNYTTRRIKCLLDISHQGK